MAKKKEIAKVPDNEPERGQDPFYLGDIKKEGDDPQTELICTEEAVSNATGFHKKGSAQSIIEILLSTLLGKVKMPDDWRKNGNKILSMMAELNPLDGYEGMLVSQMLTTYDRAMYCFRMADINKISIEMFCCYQNQGIKLMRLYVQQLESLDKHRNKGKQTMVVEHVHVNKGGKAIVGNITRDGGEG